MSHGEDLTEKAYSAKINPISDKINAINGLRGFAFGRGGSSGPIGGYEIIAKISAQNEQEAKEFGNKLSDLCVPYSARIMGRGWDVSVKQTPDCAPAQFEVTLYMFAPDQQTDLTGLQLIFLKNRGEAIEKNKPAIEALLKEHGAIKTLDESITTPQASLGK